MASSSEQLDQLKHIIDDLSDESTSSMERDGDKGTEDVQTTPAGDQAVQQPEGDQKTAETTESQSKTEDDQTRQTSTELITESEKTDDKPEISSKEETD